MKRAARHDQRHAVRSPAVGKLAAMTLVALITSACSDFRNAELRQDAVAVGLSDPELRHPIGFTPRAESLEVEVPAGADGLSPNQRVDVYRFLNRYKREGTGRLAITTPAGGDKAAVARSLREVQQQVSEAAIDYRLLRDGSYDPRSAGTPAIKLAYKRPEAVPPVCGDWTRDVGRNEERIPYPNWGCATQHNLAVMVDNGRDLGRPQAEDPRSSERRSAAWSAYQDGGAAAQAERGANAGK